MMRPKLKSWFQWNEHISTWNARISFEMHKTADLHSKLLVSWELVTEGYQGRPVKCTHFKRPLPDMVILCFANVLLKCHRNIKFFLDVLPSFPHIFSCYHFSTNFLVIFSSCVFFFVYVKSAIQTLYNSFNFWRFYPTSWLESYELSVICLPCKPILV